LEDGWVDFFRDLVYEVDPLKTREGEETLELYCENVDKIQRDTASGVLEKAAVEGAFQRQRNCPNQRICLVSLIVIFY